LVKAAIIMLCVVVLGCTPAPTTQPSSPLNAWASHYNTVTVDKVYDDYANVFNAKRLYKGNLLNLVGFVVTVSSSEGKRVIILEGDGKSARVTVYLADEAEEDVTYLQPGEITDFYGKIEGSGQQSITMNATRMGIGEGILEMKNGKGWRERKSK
jgi:hypothetical protein